MSNHNHTNEAIVGLIIGGLLAGVSTYFLTSHPRKTKNLIGSTIQEYKEKLEEILDSVSNQTSSVAKDAKKETENWTETARNFISHLKEEYEDFIDHDHKELFVGLAIGALLGGLIGTRGTPLICDATCSKGDLAAKLGQYLPSYKSIFNQVAEIANSSSIKDKLGCKTSNGCKANCGCSCHSHKNNALDLALNGLQLWRNYQSKN